MSSIPGKAKLAEALLFSTNKPLPAEAVRSIVKFRSENQVEAAVDKLNRFYEKNDRAFRIYRVAGGFQLRTVPECMPWIKRMESIKTVRLTQPLIQTLSIIAYKQPVTRPEIESIRGVDSSHTLKSLLTLNLIRILGKSKLPGKPILYATSDFFLEFFGYNSLEELPQPKDLDLEDSSETQAAPENDPPPKTADGEGDASGNSLPASSNEEGAEPARTGL